MVFLTTDPSNPSPMWWESVSATPNVFVQAKDKPSHADLRFLVGLTVCLDGTNEGRLNAWKKACIDAKAKRVIASLYEPRGEVFETVFVSDSENILDFQR